MNIALVIDNLDDGGAERIARQLATSLSAAGDHVCVYCLKAAGAPGAALRQRGLVVRAAESFGSDPLLVLKLARWLRRDRIDVMSAHSSAATVLAFAAGKLARVPVVQTRHGSMLARPTRHQALANRIADHLARVGLVAECLRDTLPVGRARRTAVLLPNSIDRPPFPCADAEAMLTTLCSRTVPRPRIMVVGSVCPEKDPLTMLAALARLRITHPTAQLVWIGRSRGSALWEQVRAAEQRLRLTGCVHWLGTVEDAWRLMPAADLYCLPSRTEAMPVSIIEAFSQGVPVVASAVGGIGDLTTPQPPPLHLVQHGHSGWLVPPASPGALAASLSHALRDTDACRRVTAAARATYQRHFTTARMVARYRQVFEEVTGRRRPVASAPAPVRLPVRPRILLLGPRPPQVGGMVTATRLLAGSPLRAACAIRSVGTPYTPPVCQPPWRWLRSALSHVAALTRFVSTMGNHRPHIVHIQTCSYFTFFRNLVDLLTARFARARVVLHIRGGRFAEFFQQSGPLARRLIRWGLETADAVIALSPLWQRRLAEIAPGAHVFVVPNAFDDAIRDVRRPPAQPRCCRFLYLARLSREKGAVDLLLAAAQLRRAGVPFDLTMAGPADTTQRRRVTRLVTDLQLDDCVRIAPAAEGAAKAALFAAHDVFVHPSHSEGLPNVVLEASAAGLAVIATDVGATRDILQPPGAARPLCPLIPARDSYQLSEAMQRMALDADRREHGATRLHDAVVAHFSSTQLAARVNAVYHAVLAGRRSYAAPNTSALPDRGPRQTTDSTPPSDDSFDSTSSVGSTASPWRDRTVVTQSSGEAI